MRRRAFDWERGAAPALRVVLAALVAVLLAACGAGAAASPSERPGPSLTRTPTFFEPSPPVTASPEPPGSPSPRPTPLPTPTQFEPTCPARPLLGVYEPSRLRVLGRCEWFVGTVGRIQDLPDRDVRVDLVPGPRYRRFVNAANEAKLGGMFPAVMIFGQPQAFILPDVGDRMVILGTWVRNVAEGWNEMHPVWEVRFGGVEIYAEPPDPPLHD